MSPAQNTRRISVGGRIFNVRADDARQPFWDRVQARAWEPHTFEVLRRFLQPDACCVDLGAWIGPTALYAATLSRCVHAVEPDPVAFAELSGNADANPALRSKLHLHAVGIGAQSGPMPLYAGGLYYGAQSQFGDSMSGMLAAPGASGQPCHEAQGVDMERFLHGHADGDCNFIKMDIEGGEYTVIPGLWRRLGRFGPPTLYASFHAPEPARRESLIRACTEELLLCYPRFYAAADAKAIALERLLDSVTDWADEGPASPWRKLEEVLGTGLVATSEEW
ncbi:FkbM family methyltransferase [Acidovorax sp. LjRoot117]|uniref:FkbM family methyltransferase n=1 Tax=Acidovorax sp. LjRoot117 TaxID=3342255 RepID=UPI003ED026DD